MTARKVPGPAASQAPKMTNAAMTDALIAVASAVGKVGAEAEAATTATAAMGERAGEGAGEGAAPAVGGFQMRTVSAGGGAGAAEMLAVGMVGGLGGRGGHVGVDKVEDGAAMEETEGGEDSTLKL